jgi:hypothetical protein
MQQRVIYSSAANFILFFSYHQSNVMIAHRSGNEIFMKEMAEGDNNNLLHV